MRLTAVCGEFAGLPLAEARRKIKLALEERSLMLGRQPTLQSIRVHERCDTPVEYIVVPQWFISVLDHRLGFLQAGQQVHWRPAAMHARYQDWVENLSWDWCISRQRYFGVPFPVWYCDVCGEVILASEADLPVDPMTHQPPAACSKCGGNHPHLGFLHHRQVVLPFQSITLAKRADLWLGPGRRRHGQDQQEPRRRADATH